jgi:hypothetical protein
MPLRDHFHGALKGNPPWESINTFWVVSLARWLNRTLPKGRYQARAEAHLGSAIEADVAEYERLTANGPAHDESGGVATLPDVDVAVATIPAVFPEEFAVHLVDRTDSNRLVGVIELVSPANKKEPAEREAFLAKCLTYLQRGIGLTIVDVVTERRANCHNELIRRLGADQPPAALPDEPIYVAGYRPVHRGGKNLLDLWPKVAKVGDALPTVPLPLRGGPLVALPLEATYTEALTDSGL